MDIRLNFVFNQLSGQHRVQNPVAQKRSVVPIRHYPAELRSTRSGGYAVTFPDFPYCVAAGATAADATAMAADVLAAHVNALLAAGASLPAPRNDQHASAGASTRQILVPVGGSDTVDNGNPAQTAEDFEQAWPLQGLFPRLPARPSTSIKRR
jgi:predicted RNase H-like HicB family nuclease